MTMRRSASMRCTVPAPRAACRTRVPSGNGAPAGVPPHGAAGRRERVEHALRIRRVEPGQPTAEAEPAELRRTEVEDGPGRLAVPPGAADLLPVGVERRARLRVGDEAHVRLVDA